MCVIVGSDVQKVSEINKFYMNHATIKLKSYNLPEAVRLDAEKYTLAKFLERDDRAAMNRRGDVQRFASSMN